ncbi:MAG: hypothetical protein KF895_16170, partial [Parvibaculum sp.]|nr:hypothetical protein [Parvibaculum sp.]
DSLWLRSLVPSQQRTGALLARESKSDIEARLRDSIGVAFWMSFTPSTKTMLLEAEIQYSRCHLDLGTTIGEHGSLAMGYFKALEHELVSQWSGVFGCDAYVEYQKSLNRREKPTLGTIEHLCRRQARLPDELIRSIEVVGPSWVSNEEARGMLLRLVEFRNRAAHGSPGLYAGEFQTIRRILFKDGFLRMIGVHQSGERRAHGKDRD